MPTFDSYHQSADDEVDEEFSMFAPGAINNEDYVADDDDDLLLPSANHRHHHHEEHNNRNRHRRRRNQGYMFSWCLDAQSDNSSAASIASTSELIPRKDSCSVKAKRILGQILANLVVSVSVIVLTLALSGGLLYYAVFQLEPAPTIDKSVTSFQIPNHNATRRQDALEQAGKELNDFRQNGRPKREIRESLETLDQLMPESIAADRHSTRNRRQVQDPASLYPQAHRWWKIQVVYLAQSDSNDESDPDRLNIFTEQRLSQIHDMEMALMKHKGFTEFCYKNYARMHQDPNLSMFGGCAPLNSLLTYFYPSVDPSGRVHYDGLGSKLEDVEQTLKFAMTRETFYWYVDDQISKTNRRSKLLRTELHFATPLPGYKNRGDRREEQSAKYHEFMKSCVELLKTFSTKEVKVLYGGTEVFDYQVESIFWGDVLLAVFSLLAIAVLMFVLTSLSVWLTVWGLVAICLSFPLAFFMYRVVFGLATLGLLNGAAAFVIIGIGVDDVFVFINTFRQASHIGNHGDRLAHTFTTAGLATFFTSFTTAAAFAANIASAIPAVYEFGLFMSLIVTCCWLSVILIMPAAINIWVRSCLSLCEHLCYSQCKCCCRGSSRPLPADMENFLSGPSSSGHGGDGDGGLSDGDVPMLGLEEEEHHREDEHHGGWMVYFGMLKEAVHSSQHSSSRHHNHDHDDPLLQLEVSLRVDLSRNKVEGCGLTRQIQAWLYYYVACPIIKWRWIVFAVFFVLLAISSGLMSQLSTSQKPPQLFKPSSNLQQLIDLTANFSDSGIPCNECSGFYKEGSVDPASLTRPPTPAPPPTTPSPSTTTTTTTTAATTTTKMTSPTKSSTTVGEPTISQSTTKTTTTTTTTDGGDLTTTPGVTTTTTSVDDSSSSKPTTATTAATTPPKGATSSATKTATDDVSSTTASSSSSSSLSTTTTEGNNVNPTKTTTAARQGPTPGATSTAATSTAATAGATVPTTPKPTTTSTTASTTTVATTYTSHTPKPRTKSPRPLPPDGPNPTPTPAPIGTSPPSPTDYDPCAFGKCDDAKERPNLELGAAVYVVFGIKGIDRSNVSSTHVLTDKGSVVYDEAFENAMMLSSFDQVALRDLCRMCHLIANNTALVKANGSQCLPTHGIPDVLTYYLKSIEYCRDLPTNRYVNGKSLPAKAKVGLLQDRLLWIAFAFESTTFKGQSYFQAYNDYQKWEAFMDDLRTNALGSDSPLRGMYQTSEFWKDVMMEVVAVTSAIYGLLFSLIICVAAVAIFTGHALLLLIVVLTIVGEIALVVAIFYMAGWQLGAVEAVSLSILVGTSVDYCMHLVEGYILAGRNPPQHLKSSPQKLRQWRAAAAVSHIGVSILSSAVTTIIAAVPLTQTTIRPFSKFGEIVAINTSASIFYTLTVCTAFLAIFAPARYRITCKSVSIAFAVTAGLVIVLVMSLYGAARMGVAIPGPSGDNLFPTKTQTD